MPRTAGLYGECVETLDLQELRILGRWTAAWLQNGRRAAGTPSAAAALAPAALPLAPTELHRLNIDRALLKCIVLAFHSYCFSQIAVLKPYTCTHDYKEGCAIYTYEGG